uniref:NADH-ubiquinone oxidoreductase chain 2 n=14 Tax=Tricholoma TaxID=40144 RepID=A0A6C0W3J7_TRIMT|nr:NADH dehydrogenase subunit 2 [Tricholoma matsutake]UIX25240.1 NADH dehydrogenase subunit 2 [Tricholoma matsutake]UIX25269.1 NADH dehydrogenase subunit 2 [Tricholoma matsutake]UIX25297.1 NADH dehydrogenase subunit 2 [Tricholoma matsutake]UIX25325.1 NADH dehydrogenase subunit 2 [Tricholoma matsutake]
MIFISILILIVAKALPSLNNNLSSIYFTRISAIIFIYAGVLSFNSLYIQSIGSGIGIYSGLFHITQVSQLIEFFFLIIASLILISWPLIQKQESKNIISYSTEYSLIVLFSTLGSSLLISSSDLVSMYLSIELQSFGLYVLSTLYRDSESSTSAGLKYFLLGGLSSCLILLGAGLIYAFTGLTNFESIYSIISVSEINYVIQGLSLGLIIIIVGFLFKIAAAPLHNWSPDVYDDTPTIVTIWLTIMPKISIIILLLELHTQIGLIGGLNSLTINTSGYAEILNSINSLITNTSGNQSIYNISLLSPLNILRGENSIYLLKNLLLISSLLSLIIGTVVGLAQTRIKRLLAYSTISHIGFILLALAINTEQSIDSLLFYIIQYSITNLNIFLIIIALSYVINHSIKIKGELENQFKIFQTNSNMIKDIRYISELKGQFFLNPLLSLSLSICLFSMAGIPPLIGFFSKQFVLYSAVQSGYNFIALVAIIVSVISASYYLKIIRVLHTETLDSNEIIEEKAKAKEKEKNFSLLLENSNDFSLNNLDNTGTILTNFHSFLISSLTLSILFFILKPTLILNSTQLLSLSLFNF